MAEVIQVTTAPGLTFDVLVDGPEQGAPVLLLHGFAESFHHWDAQVAALARAGYRAIAPSSVGTRRGRGPIPQTPTTMSSTGWPMTRCKSQHSLG